MIAKLADYGVTALPARSGPPIYAPAICVSGIFSAFYSGHTRGDRPKAQNARGGCLLGGPSAVATAVVKGLCRCSSTADVWFYGSQINILINLSIIYQYFSCNCLKTVLHVRGILNTVTRTFIFDYFLRCLFRPVVINYTN